MSPTIVLAAVLVAQSPVPDDSAVLQAVKENVNKVLKAPASARYEITKWEGTPNYPAGETFRGTVRFINEALARENYLTLNGIVDAQNQLGTFLRGEWRALVQCRNGAASRVGCVLFTDSSGAMTEAFTSKEFEAVFLAGLTKGLKEVFSDYAQEVYEVEKATEKLPYNNPKRQKLYWGELNKRAEMICKNHDITNGELEMAFVIGTRKGWGTRNPKHLDACRVMVRRKYKDTATMARRLQAQVGMTQLNAVAGAMTDAATVSAVRQQQAYNAWLANQIRHP